MNYSVKIRAVGGKKGAQSVTFSTFVVSAQDETEAKRLATIKARQRYFGDNPHIQIITVTAIDEPVPEVAEPRRPQLSVRKRA